MAPGESDRLPQKCLRMDENGNLPTCTQTGDGGWEVSYPDAAGPGAGVGGGIAVLFLLALLVGAAVTVWKVSTARRMARSSGMDPGDATAMTLMTDDGFEATYLAANLRQPQGTPQATSTAATDAPTRSPADRLRELDSLRDQGLVTEEEYAAARRAILGDL